MIEKFQCPGCVCGSNTKCGSFRLSEIPDGGFTCASHVPGTSMFPGGKILLGLPKGFNKVGDNKLEVWLYTKDKNFTFDHLNVPVWAMQENGYTFIRVYSPRINKGIVVVQEGSKLPNGSIDVSKFVDEID